MLDALGKNAFPISNAAEAGDRPRSSARSSAWPTAATPRSAADPPLELTKQLLYFVAHDGTDARPHRRDPPGVRPRRLRAERGRTRARARQPQRPQPRAARDRRGRDQGRPAARQGRARPAPAHAGRLAGRPAARRSKRSTASPTRSACSASACRAASCRTSAPRSTTSIAGQRRPTRRRCSTSPARCSTSKPRSTTRSSAWARTRREPRRRRAPTLPLPSAEARKLLEVLVKEAIVNFAQARQCFVAFVETHWDHAQLDRSAAPARAKSPARCASSTSPDAGRIPASAIRQFTENELLRRKRVPNGQQMDRLADALASLEYYLEALRDRRPNRDQILEVARAEPRVARLLAAAGGRRRCRPRRAGRPRRAAPPRRAGAPRRPRRRRARGRRRGARAGRAGAEPRRRAASPRPVAAAPRRAESPRRRRSPRRAAAAALPPPARALVPGFDGAAARRSTTRSAKSSSRNSRKKSTTSRSCCRPGAPQPDNAETAAPDPPRVPHAEGQRPPGRRAQRWASSAGRSRACSTACSTAAVRPARRCIALVAASRSTPAAAARRAAGRARCTPTSRASRRSPSASPPARKCSTSRRRRAGAVAARRSGRGAPEPSRRRARRRGVGSRVAGAAASRGVEPRPASSIDPVLFEILKPEVAGHLETVDAWLADCAARGPQPVTDPLLRSIHTMNGAFAMTECRRITDVTAPLEGFIKRSLAHRARPTPKACARRRTPRGDPQTIARHRAAAPGAAAVRRTVGARVRLARQPAGVDPAERARCTTKRPDVMPQVVEMEAADTSGLPAFVDADRIAAEARAAEEARLAEEARARRGSTGR